MSNYYIIKNDFYIIKVIIILYNIYLLSMEIVLFLN